VQLVATWLIQTLAKCNSCGPEVESLQRVPFEAEANN